MYISPIIHRLFKSQAARFINLALCNAVLAIIASHVK